MPNSTPYSITYRAAKSKGGRAESVFFVGMPKRTKKSFNCLSSFQKSVYLLEKKTVPSFLSTAFSAVINIVLNALLIPRYGGTGAAAATLTSYVALFIYRALDSRRFMPIRWKSLRLGLTVLLLAVQAALMLIEPPFWLIWQLLLFGAVGLLNSRELMAAFAKILHRHRKA